MLYNFTLPRYELVSSKIHKQASWESERSRWKYTERNTHKINFCKYVHHKYSYKLKYIGFCDWLIDCLFVFDFSSHSINFHSYVIIAGRGCKFWPMLRTHCHWAVRVCDGTYCRFVHIVVGDNMYRPSLHILSSIGIYCRRRQYVPRRPFFPSCIMDDEMCSHASAHFVVGDIMYRDHVHILSPIYYLDK